MNAAKGIVKTQQENKKPSLQGLIRAMEPEIKRHYRRSLHRRDLPGWYLRRCRATKSCRRAHRKVFSVQ